REHCPNICVVLMCLSLAFLKVIIYYVVIGQCSWPSLHDHSRQKKPPLQAEVEPLKMMLLADTHLLGPKRGHWFDKLRREWQMYRTFQTALSLHSPQVVAFLGDVFDEGQWSNDEEFDTYMERFWDLFYVPRGTKVIVVAGNHDIGFHYRLHQYFVNRFDKTFNTSAVHMTTIKGNMFVTINSMAMHMDTCSFCVHAEALLKDVERRLQCSLVRLTSHHIVPPKQTCKKVESQQYSRPVVLMHFPLYRMSDSECSEPDAALYPDKDEAFREKWDCLSKEATEMASSVLTALQPRVVFTGHTHHGCLTHHRGDIPEWTLPSISWRNKRSPSFTLAIFTPDDFAVSKCYIPQETTVVLIYVTSAVLLGFWCIFSH
ncbi:unnamed protein product, partial [Ixodes hexagonus]